MFSKEELVVIGYKLGVGKDLESKSKEDLENLIKGKVAKIGVTAEMLTNVKDAIKWLGETYPKKFKTWSWKERDMIIDTVVNYIEENYPRFDKYTMYELIEIKEKEIKEEISELI